MSLLRKKNWFQAALSSRLTLVVLILVAGSLSLAVYDRYTVEREMAERLQNTEADWVELSARKETLQKRVDYLNNEQGMEAEIRRQFDVAKEGEQVVVLFGDKAVDQEASAASAVAEEEKGSWWNIFSW